MLIGVAHAVVFTCILNEETRRGWMAGVRRRKSYDSNQTSLTPLRAPRRRESAGAKTSSADVLQ